MRIMKAAQHAVLAGLAMIGLSGCIVNIEDNGLDGVERVPPPPITTQTVCNSAPAQSYVGGKATQSAGEAVLKASGARTLRWGPPNAAWTMDYRQDRVNVRYDAAMVIVEITCG